jgi:hypothetical protein
MVNLSKRIVKKSMYLGLPGLSLAFVLSGVSPAFPQQNIEGIVTGKTPQGYAYMSGGVGVDERGQMIKQLKNYDLKLSFADRAGEYLSDVKVVINNEHGKEIVNTASNGPWFFIELPSGKYHVKATFNNRTEEIKDVAASRLDCCIGTSQACK